MGVGSAADRAHNDRAQANWAGSVVHSGVQPRSAPRATHGRMLSGHLRKHQATTTTNTRRLKHRAGGSSPVGVSRRLPSQELALLATLDDQRQARDIGASSRPATPSLRAFSGTERFRATRTTSYERPIVSQFSFDPHRIFAAHTTPGSATDCRDAHVKTKRDYSLLLEVRNEMTVTPMRRGGSGSAQCRCLMGRRLHRRPWGQH